MSSRARVGQNNLNMASRRSQRTRSVPYDTDNHVNWGSEKLRSELAKHGIKVPSSVKVQTLKTMYKENVIDRVTNQRSERVPTPGNSSGNPDAPSTSQ